MGETTGMDELEMPDFSPTILESRNIICFMPRYKRSYPGDENGSGSAKYVPLSPLPMIPSRTDNIHCSRHPISLRIQAAFTNHDRRNLRHPLARNSELNRASHQFIQSHGSQSLTGKKVLSHIKKIK